jgi:hypothetical protein
VRTRKCGFGDKDRRPGYGNMDPEKVSYIYLILKVIDLKLRDF